MQLAQMLWGRSIVSVMMDFLEMVLSVMVERSLQNVGVNVNVFNIADVDECTMGNGGCEDGCKNMIGSFFCTCPSFGDGFKANGTKCVGKFH